MGSTLTIEIGDWVEPNPEAIKWMHANSPAHYVERGPYQVVDIGWNEYKKTLKLRILDPGRGVYVGITFYEASCYKVRPPPMNLAQRERFAMSNEPWRKHRDKLLAEAFKIPERVVPVPKSPRDWI